MRERRIVTQGCEVRVEQRADGDNQAPRIVAHAAIWDLKTTIWPGHDEVVRRGAFSESIEGDTEDTVALFNHDANWPLGRESAGTLKLSEDDTGLLYEVTVPDNQTIRDRVLDPIERGDVTGSSFQFEAIEAPVSSDANGTELREITRAKLYDVSPVVFPAYPTADAQVRSALAEGTGLDELAVFLRALRGGGLTDTDIRCTFVSVLGEAPAPTPSAWTADLEERKRLHDLRLRELEL